MTENPSVSRRGLLIGLAAASTLAAGAGQGAAPGTPENPELLRLGDQVPEAERLYRKALAHQRAIEREGARRFPETPEELFLKRGEEYKRAQPFGVTEREFRGGARYRKGEEKPRRVLSLSIATGRRDKASSALAHKRLAKHGKLYGRDRASWERQFQEERHLAETAEAYYAECERLRAELNYEAVYKETSAKSNDLATLLTAIMAERETTMEGVMVKARALAAWGSVERLLWAPGMQEWGPQFAASVMRQASAGAGA